MRHVETITWPPSKPVLDVRAPLTAAGPERLPYSWEPSASVAERARRRAIAAQRKGQAGTLRIAIDGEIDEAMADRVRAELDGRPGATLLELTIDSNGGAVAAAKQMHRAIRAHAAPVKRARIAGQCASAAVLVAAGADFREALPGSRITLHASACDPVSPGRWTAARYARHAAELRRLDDELLDVLVARTGANRAALAREEADENLTPLPKALGLGIIHSIAGVSRPLDKSWPARCSSAMAAHTSRSIVIGGPSYLVSPAFFAACRAAPEA